MSQPAGDNACDMERLHGQSGLRRDGAGPGLFLVNTPTLATVPDIGHAGHAPTGGYRTALGLATYCCAKRAIDVIGATTLLVALLPIWLMVAVLIRATSPGPILFRQARIGLHNRPFTCLKFRSMAPDAEVALLANRALHSRFQQSWKLADDPRITPIGKVLRKTSLDELPQLWNVLRGDMSLVGPRPVLRQEMDDRYGEQAAIVTAVRPGMTGLWQVSGRSTTTYDRRVQLDVEYVRRRHLWFDLMILLRTIPVTLGSKDAW